LLVVSRNGPHVYALDAGTGNDLHELNLSGAGGGTYVLLLIGVADDGVVYAGNLTTAGTTTAFKLYRWANDEPATPPTTAYSGDPGAGVTQRWGDTLDVRGAGTNTQIIIGSRAGNVAAMLTTLDGTNFTSQLITVADAPTSAFGLGIAFGSGNTFWGKATSQNLRQVSFNLGAGTGTTVRNIASPDFPATVAPIGVDTALNVMGGINVGASGNEVQLYDLAPVTPALIAANKFATDNDNTGTGTGAVDFNYNRGYAIGANNGLLAMQMYAVTPPLITADPQSRAVKVGTNVTFSVSATGPATLSYQWQFNSNNIVGATNTSFTISSVNWSNAGSYFATVANAGGATNSAAAILTVLPASPSHIDTIVLQPGGQVEISASGDAGNYSIEVSTNLLDWQTLLVSPNTNGTFMWVDSVTNAPLRFYRARHGP
jgi:hypothetical protein